MTKIKKYDSNTASMFKWMHKNSYGDQMAEFYIEWATYMYSSEMFIYAQDVVNLGLNNNQLDNPAKLQAFKVKLARDIQNPPQANLKWAISYDLLTENGVEEANSIEEYQAKIYMQKHKEKEMQAEIERLKAQ